MALLITPGQWGDAPHMIEVLERIRVPRRLVGRPRTRPDHISGDKAYSSRRIAATCEDDTSGTRSPSRKTNGPTAGAEAARAADPPASTASATGAATRSSGPSTDSRTPCGR